MWPISQGADLQPWCYQIQCTSCIVAISGRGKWIHLILCQKELTWLQTRENKNLNRWKSVIGVWLIFCCAQTRLSPGFLEEFLPGSDLWVMLNVLGGGSFCAVETFHQHKCVTHPIWNIHRKFLVIEYSQQNPKSQLFGLSKIKGSEISTVSCFDSVLMSCWCWVWTKFHIRAHCYHAFCFWE